MLLFVIVSSFHLGVDHPVMKVSVLSLLYYILYCCQSIIYYTHEKLKIKQKKILKP